MAECMACLRPCTETLKKLLDILVDMANDENFPRNYDYRRNMHQRTGIAHAASGSYHTH